MEMTNSTFGALGSARGGEGGTSRVEVESMDASDVQASISNPPTVAHRGGAAGVRSLERVVMKPETAVFQRRVFG